MAKIEKLITRFLTLPSDFTWEELEKMLNYFGYTETKKGKTGGSRRKFVDNAGHMINLHKPHPGNIVKKYALKDVHDALNEKGKL
jgi:hypothetical protein